MLDRGIGGTGGAFPASTAQRRRPDYAGPPPQYQRRYNDGRLPTLSFGAGWSGRNGPFLSYSVQLIALIPPDAALNGLGPIV